MLTIAYVRVSTDDQVEHSPDAQRRRCAEFAKAKGLDAPRFFSDEGWSGKNLDRPDMRAMLELIEADQVANLIVWRLDRLSRNSSDLSSIVALLDHHCVSLHSINEGNVAVDTASGRMQAGIHGVFAQYFREQNIENIHLGNEQCVRAGLWINRPPTGYDLVDRVLIANGDAHLVRRAFSMRASGASYREIEAAIGLNYSTVKHLLDNRAYLGFTRLRTQWFPGRHEPLVTEAEFNAAHRAHVPGRPRGRDLLSGRVLCGVCGRRVAIDSNGRGQPMYRCRHRGKGCQGVPGRSAIGLHRAARMGIELLRTDDELVEAIRDHLAGKSERAGGGSAAPSHAGTIAALRRQRDKLLELFLNEKITADYFAEQEKSFTARIEAITRDHDEQREAVRTRNALAEAFERAAALLRDPAFDFDAIWENANNQERRVLVEELIESVTIYSDRLEVAAFGMVPITIAPGEVGLHDPGTGSLVSEGGLEPPRP